jgi:hypothetical protein
MTRPYFTRKVYEHGTISASEVIQREWMNLARTNMSEQTFLDEIKNQLIYKIELLTLQSSQTQEYTITWAYPASLWQHVKAVVFPRFLLKLFPVQMAEDTKTITRSVYRMCPHSTTVFDPHKMNEHFSFLDAVQEDDLPDA